jgi:hypothetical protein
VSEFGQEERSPELNLFAQLCGLKGIGDNIYDLMRAITTCISLGERGWAPAIALLNVALGGKQPIPDLVSTIPPGYIAFVKKIIVLNDIMVGELLPDIPFPAPGIYTKTVDKEETKEGEPVEIIAERYPRAFGIYIEYEHPVHGLNRHLWIIYEAGTGKYPYKAFPAPSSVAERVPKLIEEYGEQLAYAYKPLEDGFNEVKAVLKEHTVSEIEELEKQGKAILPQGFRVRRAKKEEKEAPEHGFTRRRRHPPPP